MKKLTLLSLLFVVSSFQSQERKVILSNAENLLNNIRPNENVAFWTVIQHLDGKDYVLKTGSSASYAKQNNGFTVNPHEHGYYYIAFTQSGKMQYVTDLTSLKSFIGHIDNGEEAALAALAQGYQIDFEFKDYAANYVDYGNFYLVDAGKVTSLECPLAKTHYSMRVDKATGLISEEKDLGPYFELYGKGCKNNPHYSALDQQVEEARLRAEEQKKIQKEITKKMEKRLRKLQRKD